MRRQVSMTIFLLMVLSSCVTSTATPTKSVELTPIPTNTLAPLYGMKVMSFNILFGGGADPEWEKKLQVLNSFWVGQDRLANLKKFIKEVDPDILGLQEAAGWENGTPSIVQAVAGELGMKYYYLSDHKEGIVQSEVLLSKFEISEAENWIWSFQKYEGYGLKAKIKDPSGGGIYIYVVHLNGSVRGDARFEVCEINALLQHMRPYMQEKIILMGDFNSDRTSYAFSTLKQSGLEPVQIESGRGIDQIWASPALVWSKTKWFKDVFVPIDISDHNPVAVEMEIYPGSNEVPSSDLYSPSATLNLVDCEQ